MENTAMNILQDGTEFFVKTASKQDRRQFTAEQLSNFIELAAKCIVFLERNFGKNAEQLLGEILRKIDMLGEKDLKELKELYEKKRKDLVEGKVPVTEAEIMEIQRKLEALKNLAGSFEMMFKSFGQGPTGGGSGGFEALFQGPFGGRGSGDGPSGFPF